MPSRARRQPQPRTANARVPSSTDGASVSSRDAATDDAAMQTPSPRRRLRRDPANRKVDFAVGTSKRRNVELLHQARAKCVAVIDELRAEREICVAYNLQTAVEDFLNRYPKEWQDKTLEELQDEGFDNSLPAESNAGVMPLLTGQQLLKTMQSSQASVSGSTVIPPVTDGSLNEDIAGQAGTGRVLSATVALLPNIMSGVDTSKKASTSAADLSSAKVLSVSSEQLESRVQHAEPLTSDKIRHASATVVTQSSTITKSSDKHVASNSQPVFAVPLPPKTALKQAALTKKPAEGNDSATPAINNAVPAVEIPAHFAAKSLESSAATIGTNLLPFYFNCLVHVSCATAVKDRFRNIPDMPSNAVEFADYSPDVLPRASELFRWARKRYAKVMPSSSTEHSRPMLLLLIFPDSLPNKDGVAVNVSSELETLLRDFSKLLKESSNKSTSTGSSASSSSATDQSIQCVAGFLVVPLHKIQVREQAGSDKKAAEDSAMKHAQILQFKLAVMYGALQAGQTNGMYKLDGFTLKKLE